MWWKKKLPLLGSVLFRGGMSPRVEEMSYLKESGFDLQPQSPAQNCEWNLKLRHKQWGEGELVTLKDTPLPPPQMIAYLPLSDEEKAEILQGQSSVSLKMESSHEHVLRDRKNLLRVLRAIMGRDGVAAVDHVSERFWSRAGLDDEMLHNADLDVEGIYNIHSVYGEDERVTWMHTHGLGEVGALDFDILNPSEGVAGIAGLDSLRSLSFALLEGKATVSDEPFPFAHPGGDIRLVDVNRFHREADPAVAALRDNDASHNSKRVVLCDPSSQGFFTRLFRKGLRPSRFLSAELPEHVMSSFSNEATALMSARARDTYNVLQSLLEEFDEIPCQALAKIGYVVDGGGPTDREHMWFEIHKAEPDGLDATLINSPFNIEGMKAGDRRKHDIALLTDWMIMTPAGPINPRFTTPVRRIRQHKDKLIEAVRKARAAGELPPR